MELTNLKKHSFYFISSFTYKSIKGQESSLL